MPSTTTTTTIRRVIQFYVDQLIFACSAIETDQDNRAMEMFFVVVLQLKVFRTKGENQRGRSVQRPRTTTTTNEHLGKALPARFNSLFYMATRTATIIHHHQDPLLLSSADEDILSNLAVPLCIHHWALSLCQTGYFYLLGYPCSPSSCLPAPPPGCT